MVTYLRCLGSEEIQLIDNAIQQRIHSLRSAPGVSRWTEDRADKFQSMLDDLRTMALICEVPNPEHDTKPWVCRTILYEKEVKKYE